MKFILLGIGKTKHSFVEDGIGEYLKKIRKFYPIDVHFIPINKRSKTMSTAEIKDHEAELIRKFLKPGDGLFLLDENGREFTSVDFANFLEKSFQKGFKRIIFIIGGAFGHSRKLKEESHQIISISKMTFSHQIVRVIFLEQLYRAATIIHNHPYHNI